MAAPMSTPVVFCTLPLSPGANTPAPPDAPGAAHATATGASHTTHGSPPVHGPEQRLAVVTALDGSTHVLQVDLGPAAGAGTAAAAYRPNCREAVAVNGGDAGTGSRAAPGGDGGLYEQAGAPEVAGVRCLWVARGPAPVFSAPVAVAWGAGGRGSHSSRAARGSAQGPHCAGPALGGLVVVGHVDGTVRAFPLDSGGAGAVNGAVGQGSGGGSGCGGGCGGAGSGGSPASAGGQSDDQLAAPVVAWTRKLRGNLFADLALCTTQPAGHPAATGVSGCGDGAKSSGAPWGRRLVIAATHAGDVYGLDPWSGAARWTLELQCGAISAAPAVLPMQWCSVGPGGRGRMPAAALLLVCSGAGRVFLVGLPGARGAEASQRPQEEGAVVARGDEDPWVICTAQLPGTCLTSEHLPYILCSLLRSTAPAGPPVIQLGTVW